MQLQVSSTPTLKCTLKPTNIKCNKVAYINTVMHKPGLAFKCWGCGEILSGSLGSLLLVFLVDNSLLGDEHVLSVSEIAI
jgi:ribosomal protein S27E